MIQNPLVPTEVIRDVSPRRGRWRARRNIFAKLVPPVSRPTTWAKRWLLPRQTRRLISRLMRGRRDFPPNSRIPTPRRIVCVRRRAMYPVREPMLIRPIWRYRMRPNHLFRPRGLGSPPRSRIAAFNPHLRAIRLPPKLLRRTFPPATSLSQDPLADWKSVSTPSRPWRYAAKPQRLAWPPRDPQYHYVGVRQMSWAFQKTKQLTKNHEY